MNLIILNLFQDIERNKMSKNIVVIGGGIMGLSAAYYLQQEGCQVTVIEQSNMDGGASYVNAGYITPSHIISLAAPGMMAKGIKWMFNSSSPFYMKPRLNMDFIRWAWYFNRSATSEKVQKAIPVIRDINLLSKDLYQDWHDSGVLGTFQWDKRGLLMLYKTDKAGEGEARIAQLAADQGLEVGILNAEEVRNIEPTVAVDVKGAIHYRCDAHTTPTEIMPKLKKYLEKKGVRILKNEEVMDLVYQGDIISNVITTKQEYKADTFVLASGAWSMTLAKKLRLKLPLEAGKGYRINVARPTNIQYPAVLMERKVAVTPMIGFTRFAGTMEFSGINDIIRKERVQAIAKAGEEYYQDLHIQQEEMDAAQFGMRPVTPDGLPYIGASKKYRNLLFATGHAMMGWSLGPATGKLIAEIIAGKKLSMQIEAFDPDRKF